VWVSAARLGKCCTYAVVDVVLVSELARGGVGRCGGGVEGTFGSAVRASAQQVQVTSEALGTTLVCRLCTVQWSGHDVRAERLVLSALAHASDIERAQLD
jgi:hypothetical protein